MNDFKTRIQTFLNKNRLIHDASLPLIVGLSGGADSVALLHVLVKLGYTCIPAHCNFKLRADESERDEQFSVAFAGSLGLKTETISFDTTGYAGEHKLSVEMAARELRYRWFEELRQHYRAGHIAVGHHADDNIETALFNLIRGTGLKGLTGIPVSNGSVIRPLLGVDRNNIQEYLQHEGLTSIVDSSNESQVYTRNKIRNQLIPLIQSINPSFRNSFKDTLHYLNSGYGFLQKKIDEIRQEVISTNKEQNIFSIEKFSDAGGDDFLLYELLKDYNFNSTQVKKILASLNGISGKLFYSPTHSLLKDRNKLIIQPLKATETNPGPEIICTTFTPTTNFMLSSDPHIAQLDAGKIQFPLRIRPWQAGDYFYPLGLNRKKKISDLLIDLKMDRNKKQVVYVVTTLIDGVENIVWVAGIRIDHRFRVTKSTSTIARISLI
jgi:tRNA(Ile)-lysidine synthase